MQFTIGISLGSSVAQVAGFRAGKNDGSRTRRQVADPAARGLRGLQTVCSSDSVTISIEGVGTSYSTGR